jgi:phage-related protein
MARSVKEDSGHFMKSLIVLVLVIGGYMLYTGIYDPVRAIRHLVDTLIGLLPAEIQGVVRRVMRLLSNMLDVVMELVSRIVQELRQIVG